MGPTYRLPALDQDYILGDSMRGVRFLLEYSKAEEHLRAWGIRSAVVVFGSARVRPDAYRYEQARLFGKIVSEQGGALTPKDGWRDNVIATGGGPGIMEAANRGAHEVGAPSIGFNIALPTEPQPNAYSTPELTFNFHYFAMRKMHLAMRSSALVVFPGGFGTLDELFELLTLSQHNKMSPVPIVLFDTAFWKKLVNFEFLVEEGMIAPRDLSLFAYADTAQEAWDALKKKGLHKRTAPTLLKEQV